MEDIGIVNLNVKLPVMFVFVSHRKNTHIRVKIINTSIFFYTVLRDAAPIHVYKEMASY